MASFLFVLLACTGLAAAEPLPSLDIFRAQLAQTKTTAVKGAPVSVPSGPQILISKDLQREVSEAIRRALEANVARVRAIDPRVEIRFEAHYNPRNPLVVLRGPVRDMFYLHEAWERFRMVKYGPLNPRTWLRRSADPNRMDIGDQVLGVLEYAAALSERLKVSS